MCLWWPLTKIDNLWFVKKQGRWAGGGGGGGGGEERGLFSLYIYIDNFENLLVRNHSTDFNITWQKCSCGDYPTRFIKLSWFVKKFLRQGVGLIFPIYLYRLYLLSLYICMEKL